MNFSLFFEPEKIDPRDMSEFFLKVIDVIMLPEMEDEEVIEPTGFGYQLLYITWLIHHGKLDENLENPDSPLILDPNVTPPDTKLLLKITSFPSLYVLIHEMKLYRHGYLLFPDKDEEPTNFYDQLHFEFQPIVHRDSFYWFDDENDQQELLRMHRAGYAKRKASITNHSSIRYINNQKKALLMKGGKSKGIDSSNWIAVEDLMDFKIMEKLTSQIRAN